MENLGNSLFFDQVPPTWAKRAYASMHGLSNWYSDLLLRIKELESWTSDFSLPSSVWLSGFFNPQSFLTAIMQSTARKNELPLDKMSLTCDVTKKVSNHLINEIRKLDTTIQTIQIFRYNGEAVQAPKDGAFIHGLFMEGARWDTLLGTIADSLLKELHPNMPIMHIRAITQDKQETRHMYDCPVYKTRQRGPTYIWTFNLKTKDKASKWILAGVALLLQI